MYILSYVFERICFGGKSFPENPNMRIDVGKIFNSRCRCALRCRWSLLRGRGGRLQSREAAQRSLRRHHRLERRQRSQNLVWVSFEQQYFYRSPGRSWCSGFFSPNNLSFTTLTVKVSKVFHNSWDCTVRRVFFQTNICGRCYCFLAEMGAGLNLLAQISDRISPDRLIVRKT